jgi:hypothetical protein
MNLRHTLLPFGTGRRLLLTAANVLCGPLSGRSALTACIDRLLCWSEECWRRPVRSAEARPCPPPSVYGTAAEQCRRHSNVETDGPTMRAVHRIEGGRRFRKCELVLCKWTRGRSRTRLRPPGWQPRRQGKTFPSTNKSRKSRDCQTVQNLSTLATAGTAEDGPVAITAAREYRSHRAAGWTGPCARSGPGWSSTESGGLRRPVSAAAAKPESATARRASESASLAEAGSSACTARLRRSAAARAEWSRSGARRFSTPQVIPSPPARGDRRPSITTVVE